VRRLRRSVAVERSRFRRLVDVAQIEVYGNAVPRK
jgi:hypothetical protein